MPFSFEKKTAVQRAIKLYYYAQRIVVRLDPTFETTVDAIMAEHPDLRSLLELHLDEEYYDFCHTSVTDDENMLAIGRFGDEYADDEDPYSNDIDQVFAFIWRDCSYRDFLIQLVTERQATFYDC